MKVIDDGSLDDAGELICKASDGTSYYFSSD